ncbi:MAG: MBL fold metallo-hydrolase [Candidatus Zixiibacteriota bacterium]
MFFRQIIDPLLSQHAYLIGCESTKEAVLFEPERDIDKYFKLAEKNGYKIVAAAETHIHADYLSGLRQLAERGVKVYASDEGDTDWKYEWLKSGKYNHQLLLNGDTFEIGSVTFRAVHTPGHTPEHICFEISENENGVTKSLGILTGDFMFVGDVGRPDLLETAAGIVGSSSTAAGQLFDSIQAFKKMEPNLMVWPSHGAGSVCGRALGASPMSTVEQELKFNRSVLAANDRQEFIDYILSGQPEPPYYFARMKLENKRGPAMLNELPHPKKLSFDEIEKRAQEKNAIVLDGRDWADFRHGHIKGALFAPLDKYFILVTGSYIMAETEISLICDEDVLNQTVAALARIGHDRVTGYITPDEFIRHLSKSNSAESIDEVSVMELREIQAKGKGHILDVRNAQELVESGQIEGAQNIAFTRLLIQKEEIPNNNNVYVYCRSGNRSEYACSFLKNSGLKVIHVAGGIMAWQTAGGKVVPGINSRPNS